MPALLETLSTDLAWVREHTRMSELAVAWESRDRSPDFLLEGLALRDAERWQRSHPISAPAPTPLQREFINASRASNDATARRRRRITRFAYLTAGMMLVLSFLASYQWQNAKQQAKLAVEQSKIALDQKAKAEEERARAEEQTNIAREEQKRAEQQRLEIQRAATRVQQLENALRRVDSRNPLLRQQ
jgi:hypothetical protein